MKTLKCHVNPPPLGHKRSEKKFICSAVSYDWSHMLPEHTFLKLISVSVVKNMIYCHHVFTLRPAEGFNLTYHTLILLLMFLLDQELSPPANIVHSARPSVLQKGGVIQSTKMTIRSRTVMIQRCELTKALKWSCESRGRNSTFNNC